MVVSIHSILLDYKPANMSTTHSRQKKLICELKKINDHFNVYMLKFHVTRKAKGTPLMMFFIKNILSKVRTI